MKPSEVLELLPQWSSKTPEEVFSSPAWSLPCRLGEKQCSMRLDATQVCETIDLAVKLGDESHILGIGKSDSFPGLSAVWETKDEIPHPVLLALIEKDCGPFLQLVENAFRRRLHIEGIADAAAERLRPSGTVTVSQGSDEGEPIMFTFDFSKEIKEELGVLRNVDVSHPSVREEMLEAEIEYVAFRLSAAETASIAEGDALLLPEAGTIAPKTIVCGKLMLAESGVVPWSDDEGLMRVCAAETDHIAAGVLFDVLSGGDYKVPQPPKENEPLKLVRAGRVVASGCFTEGMGHRAFIVDFVAGTRQ